MFFGRPKCKGTVEVVNDINSNIYNFWKQLRDNPDELYRVLDATPSSHEDYKNSQKVFRGEIKASDLERARATFVLFNSTYGGTGSGWERRVSKGKFSYSNKPVLKGKIESIRFLKNTFRDVYIENTDALKVIKTWDTETSFFYIDPPYPKTNQATYLGYSMKDFNNLCRLLKKIKGKFILSCYKKKEMEIDIDWKVRQRKTICSASAKKNTERTETIVMNF